MNIQWDAEKYNRDFSFVHEYGSSLLDFIEGEKLSVLDLGCGGGALTKALADRGHDAEGLDASPDLLRTARASFPHLRFRLGDAASFQTDRPYGAVFSNAVLHWIEAEKQPSVIACVFHALKPGGQFVFEMGGHGNNALIHAALRTEFEKHGLPYAMPFYFPTAGTYASLLEQGGFTVRAVALIDRPTPLKGEDGLYEWIRMFIKTPFNGLDPALSEEIIRPAVQNLKSALYRGGIWYADYVRLRCKAVRPMQEYGVSSAGA